jgi:glycosyltransferase involved in cell wall biosynthesis
MVVALSMDIFRFYRRYARHIQLVPVFVDTRDYDLILANRSARRSKFRGRKVVGVIGPFDTKWNEGSLEFLEETINKFDHRITFAIIGKCNERKIIPRSFYTGYVSDFIALLSRLDAVLVAAKISTSGPLNKIIEPMACSLPVFTTPEGFVGMDYAIPEKDIVVAKRSDMVRTVNSLIFDEALMSAIGKSARRTVEKHYSSVVNAKKLFRIISSIAP